MGKRGTKRKSRPKRKLLPTFLIIVEGKSEKVYFNTLKKNFGEQMKGIKVIPELNISHLSVKKIEEYQKSNRGYTHYFWVIDLDVVLRENRLDNIRSAIKRSRELKNVDLIINYPCLEYWFYLHLNESGNFGRECDKVIDKLKSDFPDIFKNYDKSRERVKEVTQKLLPHLERAIENSKKRGCYVEKWVDGIDDGEINCSQMEKIFEKFR